MTRICIVIPVYNRWKLLGECLDSVISQTYEDWECIVVDDGSDDASLLVAAGYSARDSRFRVLKRETPVRGAAACRNEGLNACSSPYIMFLDSDDLLHPNCLSQRIRTINQQIVEGINADLTIFPMLMFSKVPGDRDILWNIDKSSPDLLRFLKLDIPWSITGALWRTSAIKSISGFDESLPGWQDWQLHTVAILEGLTIVRANTTADSYFRQHEGEQISNNAGSRIHIEKKTAYLMSLYNKYRSILAADHLTKCAATGLVWHQVVCLERKGSLAKALRFWRRIRQIGFIDRRTYIEGSLALILHGKPGGKLAWFLISRWPTQITRSIDRSSLKVCKDCGQSS